jgi:rare lipoprotein A
MKKFCWTVLAFGLLAAPAHSEEFSLGNFLSNIFGGQTAQTADYRHHRHGYRRGYEQAGETAGQGSFMALASYYGGGPRSLEPNRHTANGERFNMWGLTAAHRSLPLGTRLLVSHGGRSVVVRVNDRGPAAWTGRSLDVSRGAAARLGLIQRGSGHVQVRVLGGG